MIQMSMEPLEKAGTQQFDQALMNIMQTMMR